MARARPHHMSPKLYALFNERRYDQQEENQACRTRVHRRPDIDGLYSSSRIDKPRGVTLGS